MTGSATSRHGIIPWPPVIYVVAIALSVVLGMLYPLPWIGDISAISCSASAGWRCSAWPCSGSRPSAS